MPTHPEADQRQSPRRPLVVTAVIVASLEIAAALGLIFLVGEPRGAVADDRGVGEFNTEPQTVELPLLAERLQNNREGFTRVFDVEIILKVRAQDAQWVHEALQRYGHEIRAKIVHLWRSLDSIQLDEPYLRTAARRIKDQMLERFGRDPVSRDAIVTDVIVISGTGFRAD